MLVQMKRYLIMTFKGLSTRLYFYHTHTPTLFYDAYIYMKQVHTGFIIFLFCLHNKKCVYETLELNIIPNVMLFIIISQLRGI